MKLKSLLLLVVLAGSLSSFAQSNLLNAKTPAEIGVKTAVQLEADNDKPLPYGYVHDRDRLYGKTVYEVIDLDERVNFPFYYPIDTANIGRERRSLFDVLIRGIKKGQITEIYRDEYFNTKVALKDLKSSFKYRDTTDAGKDIYNTNIEDYKSGKLTLEAQYIDERILSGQDITGYKVKGYWYFDKRQSELKYRLLALCPVTPEARDIGTDNPDVIELFWVYFPNARDVLHESMAFNGRNSAMPLSFDHMLNARRFSGDIYKEDNDYGDRSIEQYMKDNSQMQLLESERVKEKIRNFEQDMWNY